MSDYRLRARSSTPGAYNFKAGRIAFLPAAADVRNGVERGDGTIGTYDPITGNYTDPGKANVLLGHDYIFGGVSQVATYDEASRNTDPGVANVWTGVTYKIADVAKTGTKRASSITNCVAGNIKVSITIDDVLGTYDPMAAVFTDPTDVTGSLIAAIESRFSTSAASSDVGGRVYYRKSPDNEFPRIVYSFITTNPDNVFARKGESVLVQVDIFTVDSEDDTLMDTIYTDLRMLLDDWNVTVASVGSFEFTWQNMIEISEDVAVDDGSSGILHRAVDYQVDYQMT